jgi:hypothetical protein
MKGHNHPRIPMLERNQVPEEVGKLYDVLLEQRGVVPNMFKTVAHTPALALGIAAFLKPLLARSPAGTRNWSRPAWPFFRVAIIERRPILLRRSRRAPVRRR